MTVRCPYLPDASTVSVRLTHIAFENKGLKVEDFDF